MECKHKWCGSLPDLAHEILLPMIFHVLSSTWQPVSPHRVTLKGHLLKLAKPSLYSVPECAIGAGPLSYPQSSADLNLYCTVRWARYICTFWTVEIWGLSVTVVSLNLCQALGHKHSLEPFWHLLRSRKHTEYQECRMQFIHSSTRVWGYRDKW